MRSVSQVLICCLFLDLLLVLKDAPRNRRRQKWFTARYLSNGRDKHNYVTALGYGLRRVAKLPVSLCLIREIHPHMMKGVRGEHLSPGEFRRTPNWISPAGSAPETALYVPPPPEEMRDALADFESHIDTESDLRSFALDYCIMSSRRFTPFWTGMALSGGCSSHCCYVYRNWCLSPSCT